jgi:hypothetical protein
MFRRKVLCLFLGLRLNRENKQASVKQFSVSSTDPSILRMELVLSSETWANIKHTTQCLKTESSRSYCNFFVNRLLTTIVCVLAKIIFAANKNTAIIRNRRYLLITETCRHISCPLRFKLGRFLFYFMFYYILYYVYYKFIYCLYI